MEKMIIKRSKDYKMVQSFGIFLIFLSEILFIIEFGDLIFVLALFIPLYIGTLSNLIAQGRSYILDADGCTVCFWKYRKMYRWAEFKTKRIEKHILPSMFRGDISHPYLEDIIFSPKVIHKPKFLRAEGYSVLHPFTCIYFHFAPTEESNLVRSFEVKKEEFLSRMAQWGIELTITETGF